VQGAAVEFVRPGSAADKAGVRPGDVIVGAAGARIVAAGGQKSAHELSSILASARPGDTIQIVVLRGGKPATLTLKLDAKVTSETTSAAHGFDRPTPRP
jgi:S1-C subfamily serine protease